jgi:predicted DNA-binding helix-hairpin-helix protein
MLPLAIGLGVFTAYSSYQQGRTQRKMNEASQEDTRRRYLIMASDAESGKAELAQEGMEKMTQSTREFLKYKSTYEASLGESETGGKSIQRMKANIQLKRDETMGSIQRQIDENSINIAKDMLTKKIDTEANLRQLELSKQSTAMIALQAIGTGASTGLSVGASMKTLGWGQSGTPTK